jgi:4-hydroxybenzoate polyprenyltransferase
VFAWLGATGQLPGAFAVLVPAAVLAGSGLAIGNALADFDRDRLAGAGSIARSLGEGRAWWVHVGLLGLASAIAIGSIVLQEGGAAGPRPAQPGLAVALAGAGVVIAGAWFARRPRTAERGWEVEAVGLVVVAVGWMIGTDLRS